MTGDINRQQGSGRPKSIRTEENVELVEDLILSQDQPGMHTTPSEIALELGIGVSSVYRIIDEDLDLRPLKKQKVQKLSDADIEKRMVRSKRMLTRYYSKNVLETAFFSDEKIFKVKKLYNTKNDVVYASKRLKKSEISEERIIREQQGFPEKVMVSVGISKAGKTSVIFVEDGKTVNAQYYCKKLLKKIILEMNKLTKYLFMQDGARAHTAKLFLDMLHEQLQLLEPKDWPPNSPDLNPVDYCIWGILEQNVYRGRKITDLDTLKSAIKEEWNKNPQETINNCIDVFRARLRRVGEAEGKHIELY